MAFSSGRKFGTALAEINVTPLVDVVLVLLIIFMVTAPLMHRGVDVDLPRTTTQTSENEERLIVSLDKKGMVYIDDIQIPVADLKEQIQRRLPALKNKNAIFLRADKTLQYGTIMEVMDQIKSAGVPTVGLVTEAQKKTKREPQ